MQCSFQELLVLARPEVIEMLLNEQSVSLIELEELVSAPIPTPSTAT